MAPRPTRKFKVVADLQDRRGRSRKAVLSDGCVGRREARKVRRFWSGMFDGRIEPCKKGRGGWY